MKKRKSCCEDFHHTHIVIIIINIVSLSTHINCILSEKQESDSVDSVVPEKK